MAVLLGLAVAAGYGIGDFFGGLASRRSPTAVVLLGAQVVGLVGLLAVVLATGTDGPSARDIGVSAAAGLAGTGGLGALFHGLSVGRMTVVAPIAAVVASTIPVVWGLATGEDPTHVALAGVVLAIGAGGLIGLGEDAEQHGTVAAGVALALTAGAGFGTAFVLFSETSDGSGVWPAVLARASALPFVLAVAFVTARRLVPSREIGRPVAASGMLDAFANSMQLVAVRQELLSLVAPVAALAPAFTVLLARLSLGERSTRAQVVGVLAALAGLALIAAGS